MQKVAKVLHAAKWAGKSMRVVKSHEEKWLFVLEKRKAAVGKAIKDQGEVFSCSAQFVLTKKRELQ